MANKFKRKKKNKQEVFWKTSGKVSKWHLGNKVTKEKHEVSKGKQWCIWNLIFCQIIAPRCLLADILLMLEMLDTLRYSKVSQLAIPLRYPIANREALPTGPCSRLSIALMVVAVYWDDTPSLQSSSQVPSFPPFLRVSLQKLIAFTALMSSVHLWEHKLNIASAHVGMYKAPLAHWCFTSTLAEGLHCHLSDTLLSRSYTLH